MKRIIAMLLLLSMLLALAACQPTPEHEIVINKGDGVVERKLNATPKPIEDEVTAETDPDASKTEGGQVEATAEQSHLAPQTFPDRWDADAEQVNERLSVAAHADVLQRADGLYPVYRTRATTISLEQASALASALLIKPVEVYTQEPTKEEYKRQLQDYLDTVAEQQAWIDAGKPDWGDRDETVFSQEQIDEQTARYMELIQNAPDTLETRQVSDYSCLKLFGKSSFTLEDGSRASVSWRDKSLTISKGCSGLGYVYLRSTYEEEREEGERNAKLWKNPTADRAAAEQRASEALEKLGFSGFAMMQAEEANLLDQPGGNHRYVASGWVFTFRRDYGGYPSVSAAYEPSQFLQYSEGYGFVANKPINTEQIRVMADENGVWYFGWSAPKETVKLVNESVELLPFAEVQRIAKDTLSVCFPYDRMAEINGGKHEIEIYRMLLTTFTLRVPDSDDYYEMPCWVIFFDGMYVQELGVRERERTDEHLNHDVLVLNAIDGSVVHTDYGF